MSRLLPILSLSLASLLSAPAVSAQAEAELDLAARAYDEGVTAYDAAEYARAARAFVRADEAVPSADAVANALAAAVRSGEHLLVIEVAERILSRSELSAELQARARKARTFAATKLARVRLRCEPRPCGIAVDGRVTKAGEHFVLPGTHELVVIARDGRRSERAYELQAGATYEVLLHAARAGEAAREFELSQATSAAPAEPPPDAGSIVRREQPAGDAAREGWSPAVFYVGAGLTLVLAGETTWSGLDALGARDDLPAEPSRSQVNAVEGRVQRTDLLLAGTVVTGVASAFVGLNLVEWGSTSAASAAAPPRRWARATLRLTPLGVQLGGTFR